MKMRLIALAPLALAACTAATPPVQPITPPDSVPADCSVTVTFASYAMGIDGDTYDAVEKLLADLEIAPERYRWGREGEVTLCVRGLDGRKSGSLFAKIEGLLPEKPRGPVSVSTRSGKVARAPAEN